MSYLQRQNGVASLVGVTLTSFLILILTVAIATFMNGEVARATDAADSIKAYYVAQSSAEEAILDIKNQLADPSLVSLSTFNQGCNADTTATRIGAALPGLVCRQIQAYTKELQSVTDSDTTVQFDFTNSPTQANLNIDRVELQWDSRDIVGTAAEASAFVSPPSSAAALNGASGAWGAPQVPPAMELTVSNYFPTQQTTIDNNTSGTVLIVPQWQCSAGTCPAWVNFQNVSSVARATAAGTTPLVLATCSATTLRCKATLFNVAPLGYKTIMRLTSRYGAARFNMKVYDYSNQQVQIPLKNAQIDVTAQVGEAYRRIVFEVPVRSGAYPFQVLYGDSSLCKDFDIVNVPASGYEEVHPQPLCPLTTGP